MMKFPDRHGPGLRRRIEQNLSQFERRTIRGGNAKAAAVSITILPNRKGQACFVLTRRAAKLKRHGGQWALPGGRVDANESAESAALRELSEEVGLTLDATAVVGLLDDYATRSGFVITPVLTWCSEVRRLRRDPREVARVYRIPLSDLDRPEAPILWDIPESDRPVIAMPLARGRVHAPTAAILYQLLEVVLRGRIVRVAHYEQPVFAWR